MKHTLFSILVCLPLHVLPQSTGQNYVMTESMLDAGGDSKITSVQYCDGLGRPDILATDGLNTDGKTAYRLTVYDYSGLVSEIMAACRRGQQPGLEGSASHQVAGCDDQRRRNAILHRQEGCPRA